MFFSMRIDFYKWYFFCILAMLHGMLFSFEKTGIYLLWDNFIFFQKNYLMLFKNNWSSIYNIPKNMLRSQSRRVIKTSFWSGATKYHRTLPDIRNHITTSITSVRNNGKLHVYYYFNSLIKCITEDQHKIFHLQRITSVIMKYMIKKYWYLFS